MTVFTGVTSCGRRGSGLGDKIRARTGRNRAGADIGEVIADLNPILRGWGNYFRTGNAAVKFRQADDYVVQRLRSLMVNKRGRNLHAGQADIGCGCGDVTILAARATRRGHALGAYFSRIQVAEARRLAAAAGIGNVGFEVADVQVHPFGAGVFDVVLSNFGVMFFDDPAPAFGNLRNALRRGGRLAFLCWRTREENPFFTVGFAEAAAVLGLHELPGPGAAFSLAVTSGR